MEKYIKVTRPDGSFVVINANNRDYYLSMGAKIDIPTDEEIREFHGAAATQNKPEIRPAIEGYEAAMAEREARISELEAEVARLSAALKAATSKKGKGTTKK